jgi:hypothetical protein
MDQRTLAGAQKENGEEWKKSDFKNETSVERGKKSRRRSPAREPGEINQTKPRTPAQNHRAPRAKAKKNVERERGEKWASAEKPLRLFDVLRNLN